MSGQNVIPLDPSRRAQSAVVEEGVIAMLVFVIFEAMMFAGMVSAFMLTRAAAGDAWPPAEQPWFPLAETAINTAALLVSGVLVFLAGRAWERREARVGPLLLTAITLGAFFLFFQGVVWVVLLRQGLTLTSSQPGIFFCITVGMHGANTLGALSFLGVAWLRLKPFRSDEGPRGSLRSSTFSAARILWYFVVGVWPVLYLCLYL
jgi:heme/copper-type cytochrome/quinol oxidase subunit 3